tara:strand:+ start:830 stop:979 length:150 start_codon:yes stop_codon:yes gene_type:complete
MTDKDLRTKFLELLKRNDLKKEEIQNATFDILQYKRRNDNWRETLIINN